MLPTTLLVLVLEWTKIKYKIFKIQVKDIISVILDFFYDI